MWNAPHPIPIINFSLDLIGPYLSQNIYSMMDYSKAGTIKKNPVLFCTHCSVYDSRAQS